MTFVETIRVENGIVHNLDFHQERVRRTAFFHYGKKPEIKIDVSSISPHLQGKRVKCRVLYSSDILSVEFHPYQFKNIQSLQIVEDNDITYEYKSTDRTALNELFKLRKGADEIIIAKNRRLTDSSFSNLVFESLDGELFTPETYLLAGTKRAFLLKNGIVREREIAIDDLSMYRKVYLINAMIDLEDDISVQIPLIRI